MSAHLHPVLGTQLCASALGGWRLAAAGCGLDVTLRPAPPAPASLPGTGNVRPPPLGSSSCNKCLFLNLTEVVPLLHSGPSSRPCKSAIDKGHSGIYCVLRKTTKGRKQLGTTNLPHAWTLHRGRGGPWARGAGRATPKSCSTRSTQNSDFYTIGQISFFFSFCFFAINIYLTG